MDFSTPAAQLHGVGKMLEKRLRVLGIETAEDLVWRFPFRYEDYRTVAAIKDLRDGDQTTVRGQIEMIASKRSPRKRKFITEAVVSDGTGQLRAVWFGQPFIAKVLRAGDVVFLSGKVKSDMFGVSMAGPVYEKIQNLELSRHDGIPFAAGRIKNSNTVHTARIVPIYSVTAGITQKQIRYLVSQAIRLAEKVDEWLPDEIRDMADVMPLGDAIRAIHFPEDDAALQHAERRLKFDELFILQLRAEMIRRSMKRRSAPAIRFDELAIRQFVASLPFALTKDQKIAAWEIIQDMEKTEPMNRLLSGDVGSGKTVVAAIAAYSAALNGYQTAILAPTEILAKQHYDSLCRLFAECVSVGLLTRTKFSIFNDQFSNDTLTGEKGQMTKSIFNGIVHVLVGTHALLNEDVRFQKLGLVIVDEQHRFGVEQRKTIREKSGNGAAPHFLSMTATPIPRSLALTLYGDLDLSTIREMPPGRKPVKTRLVDPHNREKAYQFIKDQIRSGRQAFVVCPLIERKEEDDNVQFSIAVEKKSVMWEYGKLSKDVFPDLRVGYLHGKMKPKEKDEAIRKFQTGQTDILVSTSVVEVGVDIPNASVMMIEGAEHFGLAQLHQFRGRVGRSCHQSYCFVFTDSETAGVRERLAFFEKNTDGFRVAEYDLHTRGPGEVYGTAQSGLLQLRLATLRDTGIMKTARAIAREIDTEKFPTIRKKVREWEERVHLE